MPGCNTGRNIQKYKGAGASTLQDALENGNTASLDVVLQSPAVFIGDGGGLSNINASSTTGNLQAVTNNGATSTTKITLTNSATSLETTGNIVVSTNVYATEFYGDGGTLSNIAANKNFQDVTTLGNTSSLTISFTNPAESITTTGNVIVGTNVHATEFVGDGSSLTSLNADNIDSGDLAIARGGTGVTTGLNVLDPSKLNTAVFYIKRWDGTDKCVCSCHSSWTRNGKFTSVYRYQFRKYGNNRVFGYSINRVEHNSNRGCRFRNTDVGVITSPRLREGTVSRVPVRLLVKT